MKYKMALAQTENSSDTAENLKKAESMIRKARENGASIIVFPEIFLTAFPKNATLEEKLKAAEGQDGPSVKKMRELAETFNIWVVFGMYEPVTEDLKGNIPEGKKKRNYNTTVVLDGFGNIVRKYHKTHLFDAFSYRESDYNKAGDELFEPVDTPFGKLGLLVCYEIRFPEIARYETLKGADVIIMPTSWFSGEGKSMQLRSLVTSRAIENTVYVALCDMCGKERTGESALIDPLGNVITQAGSEETLLIAEIDTDIIAKVRKNVPSLENRRPELYLN